MKNNIIERTCIVCREKKDRSEFIRIVKNKDNQIMVDKTGKASGRGCYICDNDQCKLALYKTKALNRTFKTNFSEDIYDAIRTQL